MKLLRDKLSARNFQSQVNKIHARAAVLNKFTDLGRPHTRVVTLRISPHNLNTILAEI